MRFRTAPDMNKEKTTCHTVNEITVRVRQTDSGFVAFTRVNGEVTSLTHNHDASEMEPLDNQPVEVKAMREAIRERRLANSFVSEAPR